MPESLWKSADSAAAVFGRFDPREDMPAPDMLPAREYFGLLCGAGRFADAVVFLAHLLPKREVVWWGCLCLWRVERPQPSSAVDSALGAVLRWVLEPSEANCQAAQPAADAAGDVPAGFLARAVSFSGASMTPPGLPVEPPPPYLVQGVVAGTLQMATAKGGDDTLREFLSWGSDVADGKNRWN